jgi:ribosomal protein S18 acetylase RimI-like enzyme
VEPARGVLGRVGWIGFGLVVRAERRRLSSVTIVLGVACLVDSLGTALNTDVIASTGLTVYLILAPIWACWMGVWLLRPPSAGVAPDSLVAVKN